MRHRQALELEPKDPWNIHVEFAARFTLAKFSWCSCWLVVANCLTSRRWLNRHSSRPYLEVGRHLISRRYQTLQSQRDNWMTSGYHRHLKSNASRKHISNRPLTQSRITTDLMTSHANYLLDFSTLVHTPFFPFTRYLHQNQHPQHPPTPHQSNTNPLVQSKNKQNVQLRLQRLWLHHRNRPWQRRRRIFLFRWFFRRFLLRRWFFL